MGLWKGMSARLSREFIINMMLAHASHTYLGKCSPAVHATAEFVGVRHFFPPFCISCARARVSLVGVSESLPIRGRGMVARDLNRYFFGSHSSLCRRSGWRDRCSFFFFGAQPTWPPTHWPSTLFVAKAVRW